MRDCRQYYSNYSDLKEDDSLCGIWFFKECFNPDCNGSRFAVELHDGRKNIKNLNAIKAEGAYIFKENQ